MMRPAPFVKLAGRLTAAQRHCVLRCSDAEEWCNAGYGMARSWPDIVAGRKRVSHRSLVALERLGIVFQDEQHHGWQRLTRLGLSVQLELRARLGKGAW